MSAGAKDSHTPPGDACAIGRTMRRTVSANAPATICMQTLYVRMYHIVGFFLRDRSETKLQSSPSAIAIVKSRQPRTSSIANPIGIASDAYSASPSTV